MTYHTRKGTGINNVISFRSSLLIHMLDLLDYLNGMKPSLMLLVVTAFPAMTRANANIYLGVLVQVTLGSDT